MADSLAIFQHFLEARKVAANWKRITVPGRKGERTTEGYGNAVIHY